MGGAGAALACAKQGFKDIHVWEAAPAIGEVGAGINIPSPPLLLSSTRLLLL
jgi:salicylate hydroxylase